MKTKILLFLLVMVSAVWIPSEARWIIGEQKGASEIHAGDTIVMEMCISNFAGRYLAGSALSLAGKITDDNIYIVEAGSADIRTGAPTIHLKRLEDSTREAGQNGYLKYNGSWATITYDTNPTNAANLQVLSCNEDIPWSNVYSFDNYQSGVYRDDATYTEKEVANWRNNRSTGYSNNTNEKSVGFSFSTGESMYDDYTYLASWNNADNIWFWNYTDTNQWNVYAVSYEKDLKADLQDLINTYTSESSYIGGTDPGFYEIDAANAYHNALQEAQVLVNDTASDSQLQTAIDNLETAHEAVLNAFIPITEGYYYFVSAFDDYLSNFGHEKAAYVNTSANELYYKTFDPVNAEFIFKITKADDADEYWVQSLVSGSYVGNPSSWYSSHIPVTSSKEEPQNIRYYNQGGVSGKWFWGSHTQHNTSYTPTTNGTLRDNDGSLFNWGTWNDAVDNQYNCWYLRKVTDPRVIDTYENSNLCYEFDSLTHTATVVASESSKYSGDINIPSIVMYNGEGYSVTAIGNRAFYNCSGLNSITIPNSVTNIGDLAFYKCLGLTSITIPNSVATIGYAAFSNCSGLISLTIPNTITSIERYAFQSCTSLTSLTIPSSVTSIGELAFDYCYGLTSLTIPNSVTSIGRYAFSECTGLTSMTIPSSVTSIGEDAFFGCKGLTNITVESNNPTYDSRESCNAIIETASNTLVTGCKNTIIPSSVKIIGYRAFYSCSGLTSITIPDSVTTIREEAFGNCIGLTSLTIPSSVTSIGKRAFYSCYGLTSVSIPSSVTSIGEEAFYCASLLGSVLTNINLYWDNPEICECGNYCFPNLSSNITYIPEGSLSAYQASSYWGQFNLVERTAVDDTNKLYAEDIVLNEGTSEVVLPVVLKNEAEISDLQFDLYLPAGFSIAKDGDDNNLIAVSTERTTSQKHFINSQTRADGSVRIMCTSPTGNTFSGDSGAVVNITLAVADTIGIGTYEVELKNIRISNSENTFKPADATATITVEEYVPVTHTVTYIVDGTTYQTETYAEGADITPLAEPTKEGYTFSGWSEIPAVMGTEDITITGTFAINKYKITYIVDGTTWAEDSIAYGAAITPLAEPTKEGYTFSGWSDIPSTMGTEDITVTGTFTENAVPVTDPDTDISQLDNTIYAVNATGKVGGEMEFSISMKNSIEATGFQFDLVLPEGITVAEEDDFPLMDLSLERTTRKKTDYFNSEYQTDGSLRVLCNSTKGYAFTGNDGEVAVATLNIAADLEDGDYPVILKNIIITDATGNERHTVDRVKSTITIESYLLGDANGDGNVDVSDFSAIAAKILGHPADNFVEKAADINGDTNIDVSDLSGLAYMILHPDAGSAGSKAFRTARIVGADPDYSTMADTDPSTYTNTIYASKATGKAGQQTTLTLNMLNDIEATGFQMDIYLPEGATFAIDEEGFPMAELSLERTTARRTDYFNSEIQTDGALRVLCNSTKGYAFSGNDGEVALVTLNLAATMADGDYPIVIKNIVVTDATGNERFAVEMMKSTLTVGDVAPVYDQNYNLQIIPFQIAAGTDDTIVDLLMQNKEDGEINMVDFDLVLPAGINLYQEDGDYIVDAGSRFASSTIRNRFACDVDENTDGTLHISAYFTRTTASYVFSGTSGDIAALTLVADDALADGIYEIELKNIVFNEDNSIQIAPYKTSVFVGKPEVTDAVLYGNYTADAIDALNDCLATDSKLTSIDLSNAVAIEDDSEILVSNDNCLIYVPEGTQLANVDNVVIGDVCSDLYIEDMKPFSVPKAFTATTAEYERTMTNEWGTICLPYAISSDENMELYNITGIGNSNLVVEKISELAAGTPALVRRVGGTGINPIATDVPVSATINSATNGTVTMFGSYEEKKIDNANAYYIKSDKFWQCNNYFYCDPFRAYFVADNAGSNSFGIVISNDEPTGINSAVNTNADKAVVIYSIDGKQLGPLQQGVNIVKLSNGSTKKVVVK